jgi:hypothetical protein
MGPVWVFVILDYQALQSGARHGLRHQLIAGAAVQQAARGGFCQAISGLPVEALTTPPQI